MDLWWIAALSLHTNKCVQRQNYFLPREAQQMGVVSTLTFSPWSFLNADKYIKALSITQLAKITKYDVSFQEDQLLRRNVLNITESKNKRPPFFLPRMNLNTKIEKCQRPEIGLDVRGQGVKADGKGYGNKTRQKQKRTRKHRNRVNSFPSPGNKGAAHEIRGFSLPPIDFKSLTHNPATKNDPGCPSTMVMTPQQKFEIVFTTLMSVIERSKKEQKRTAEKFRRSIVQGKQKPINEKLQWPGLEEAKTGCSPQMLNVNIAEKSSGFK